MVPIHINSIEQAQAIVIFSLAEFVLVFHRANWQRLNLNNNKNSSKIDYIFH